MSWPDFPTPWAGEAAPRIPPQPRFPHCAACQKSPGKLCPGHGAAARDQDDSATAEREVQP